MPTTLLSNAPINLLHQTPVHPQNPAANLKTPNPELVKPCRNIFWKQAWAASLKQQTQDCHINLIAASCLTSFMNHTKALFLLSPAGGAFPRKLTTKL